MFRSLARYSIRDTIFRRRKKQTFSRPTSSMTVVSLKDTSAEGHDAARVQVDSPTLYEGMLASQMAPVQDPSKTDAVMDPAASPIPRAIQPFTPFSDLHLDAVSHKKLDLNSGPVQGNMEWDLMSEKQREDVRPLNAHLGSLYSKIMELSTNSEPMVPRNLRELEAKMAKGLLMEDADNDQFARDNKLQIAHTKFEKHFSKWVGRNVLDQDLVGEQERLQAEKAAVYMHVPPPFEIPVIGTDPCPGCGALFQSDNEQDFGFITHVRIHKWLTRYSLNMRAKTGYAERRYRLMQHWAEKGKQFGEEWLDFMTQEEFEAFHLDNGADKPIVCSRCLALKNYRTTTEDTVMTAPDFKEQLRALRDERGVFVFVCDLTDFNATMVYDIQGLISMNNPVLIVANKLDLIQEAEIESTHKFRSVGNQTHSFYRSWIFDQLKNFNINTRLVHDVMVVSARRKWYIEELAERIEQMTNVTAHRRGEPMNAYFVGCTNVGKSSLLNKLIQHYSPVRPPHPDARKEFFTKVKPDGTTEVCARWNMPPHASPVDLPQMHLDNLTVKQPRQLTTAPIPGTTIRMSGIPLMLGKSKGGQGVVLYDTPGIIPDWQRTTVLNLREQTQCSIQTARGKRLRPVYYSLTQGYTLFLGGLACLDIVRCGKHGVLLGVYVSAAVTHMKEITARAEDTWRQGVGNSLTPPYDGNVVSDGLTKKRSFLFECFQKHVQTPKADIYIEGLGWVCLYSARCDLVVRVRAHASVKFGVRPPLRYRDLELWRRADEDRRKNNPRLKHSVWPMLPSAFVGKDAEGALNAPEQKIIQLVAEPVEPGSDPSPQSVDPEAELEGQARKKPTVPLPDIDQTQTPFDDILAKLRQQGRIV